MSTKKHKRKWAHMKSEIFPHKDIALVSITIKNTRTED
jgi:hypothetical protein